MLLVALLPLRGWAAAGMAVPALAGPVSAHASEACHAEARPDRVTQAPASEPEEGAARQGDEGTSAVHACASCAICHGCVWAPAGGVDQPGPGPRAAPAAACPRDTGRLWVASLERPPRA